MISNCLPAQNMASTSQLRQHKIQGDHNTCHIHHPTERSHFEDFMLEIGVDPHMVHLCCIPRQNASRTHRVSKSPLKSKLFAIGSPHDIANFPQSQNIDVPPSQRRKIQATSEHSSGSVASKSANRLSLAQACVSNKTSISQANEECKSNITSAIQTSPGDVSVTFHTAVTTARDSLLNVIGRKQFTPLFHGKAKVTERNHCVEDGVIPPTPSTVTEHPPLTPMPTQSTSYASTSSSLSRVPSIASMDTTSSSEGPATPRLSSPLLHSFGPNNHEFNRTLSDLENMSRWNVKSLCVTCKKSGQNFPSCPKCGHTWCSRKCRMLAADASGKHSCHCNLNTMKVVPDDLLIRERMIQSH
ncbi:hypothetical protein ABKN59_002625 [Abortiporus biennis]